MPDIDQNKWFVGTRQQTRRSRAFCQITVNGVPVTDRLDPFLISVRVFDGSPFVAEIELDDRDGRLPIPPLSAPIHIELGWASENMIRVFSGWIREVEHGFGRTAGGRRMWIHGLSYNAAGTAKQQEQSSAGEGAPPGQQQGEQIPLSSFMNTVAGAAGMTADVGASLANVTRDHWSQTNESPMSLADRFKDDFGAFMRVEGNAFVMKRVQDFDKPAIVAQWGDNLIAWKMHPYAARPAWSGGVQQHFNTQLGQWKEIAQKFGLGIPWGIATAMFRLPVPAPNEAAANQDTGGVGEVMAGFGRITINGEPNAAWGGTITLKGARPGVDGTYFINSAEHLYSRQGYVTICETRPISFGKSSNIGDQGYEQTRPPAPAKPSNSVEQILEPHEAEIAAHFGLSKAEIEARLKKSNSVEQILKQHEDEIAARFGLSKAEIEARLKK